MVSVVTPVYNLAHTLPEAINSLTSQTYRDLEILIVNDASPDDAGSVAERLARQDNRIRVIHNEENQGLPRSLNIGFSQAKGEAFIILSPDDMLHKTTIGTMRAQMLGTGADIVSVDMLVGGRAVPTKPLDLETLKHSNCFGYAALFKRWVFNRTGGFKETMNPSWEDYEFWLNAAKLGATGTRVPQPLFIYRPNPVGRGAEAQGQDRLLRGKLEGYHQDLFGKGRGVVTFVIPLYDQEEWVRYAAETALAQIYPHIEVIVVDDGSPGNPIDALQGLPVHLIRQENRGLSGARNVGVWAAISEFASQYAVFLDADDGVDGRFVERAMGTMKDSRQYVYTDLVFIGDAWHDYEVFDFDCEELWKRHLHPCTFLFETGMWRDVVAQRGYGYDENMRQGWEDWEFALACVEAGWCGLRLPEPLFQYRYHAGGSMRTRANAIKKDLGLYVRSRHGKEKVMAGCRGCGGAGRHTRQTAVAALPGGGNVDMGDPIKVTYRGSKTGTMTKLGRGGRIYRYSGKTEEKRVFFADAQDIHLFQGPFSVERVQATSPAPPRVPATTAPVALKRMDAPPPSPGRPAPPPAPPPMPRPPQVSELTEKDIREVAVKVSATVRDDLTDINGVGPVYAKRLIGAGITTFLGVVQMNVVELAQILGSSVQKAQEVINGAADLAD